MTDEEVMWMMYGQNVCAAETKDELEYVTNNFVCYPYDRKEYIYNQTDNH